MKNRIYSSYEKQLGTEPSLKRSLDGIAIEFNRRKIIELHPDGTHVINTGGWRTPSVRAKIESAIEKLGFTIVQQKGHWYLESINADSVTERYVFEDGITLHPNGKVTGAKLALASTDVDSDLIDAYVDAWFTEWQTGQVCPPSPSDPHTFYAVVADGKRANKAEMRQQMVFYYGTEYYFGSLLMVALKDAGGSKTDKLDVIGKVHVEDWLKGGDLLPCKLIEGTSLALKNVLKEFLYRLHGIRGEGVRAKK